MTGWIKMGTGLRDHPKVVRMAGVTSPFRTARVAPEKAAFRPALPLRSSPGLNGTTMPLSYREQLLHPNWQRRRLERLSLSQWKCDACTSAEVTLHVHHKRYVKGRMAWEYDDDELSVLCDPCHQTAHATRELLMRLLCYAESFPQAGITELDLVKLGASFMRGSGLADSDELIELASGGSTRMGNVGFAAGAIFTSDLGEIDVCDLVQLLQPPWIDRLRELLAACRADLARQISEDRGAG